MKNRIKYKGFYIDKTENGYRICRQEDTEKHTHLSNLNPSYRLIDNVLSNKIPTRCGCYYLESHIRLSYDENYIRKIREYIEVKQNKRLKFIKENGLEEVPIFLQTSRSISKKNEEYKYPHDYENMVTGQEYLPEKIKDIK